MGSAVGEIVAPGLQNVALLGYCPDVARKIVVCITTHEPPTQTFLQKTVSDSSLEYLYTIAQ